MESKGAQAWPRTSCSPGTTQETSRAGSQTTSSRVWKGTKTKPHKTANSSSPAYSSEFPELTSNPSARPSPTEQSDFMLEDGFQHPKSKGKRNPASRAPEPGKSYHQQHANFTNPSRPRHTSLKTFFHHLRERDANTWTASLERCKLSPGDIVYWWDPQAEKGPFNHPVIIWDAADGSCTAYKITSQRGAFARFLSIGGKNDDSPASLKLGDGKRMEKRSYVDCSTPHTIPKRRLRLFLGEPYALDNASRGAFVDAVEEQRALETFGQRALRYLSWVKPLV